MRDVVKEYGQAAISSRWWRAWDRFPDENVQNYTYTYPYLKKLRGRSDITTGDGQTPTYYRAYRLDSTLIHQNRLEANLDKLRWTRYWVQGPFYGQYGYRQTRQWWEGSAGFPDSYLTQGLDADYSPNVSTARFNEARTKALNELSDSEVNLGQSAGEFRSTIDFITDKVKAGVDAIRHLRRRNFGKAARSLGIKRPTRTGTAKAYLEYHFGFLPLMNDIYNGVEAIKKAQLTEGDIIDVTAIAVGNKTLPFGGSYDYSGDLEEGVQVGYRYKLTDAERAAFDTLGLLNPASLAWELVPSSFVINWFISVGDVLRALSAPLAYEYLGGYETAWIRGDFQVTSDSYPGYKYGTEYGIRVKSFAMERIPKGVPPRPGLYMKSGLNFGQALTIVALLNRK